MFCRICGNEINEEAFFCTNCGCAIKENRFDETKSASRLVFNIFNYISTGLFCLSLILDFLFPIFKEQLIFKDLWVTVMFILSIFALISGTASVILGFFKVNRTKLALSVTLFYLIISLSICFFSAFHENIWQNIQYILYIFQYK